MERLKRDATRREGGRKEKAKEDRDVPDRRGRTIFRKKGIHDLHLAQLMPMGTNSEELRLALISLDHKFR